MKIQQNISSSFKVLISTLFILSVQSLYGQSTFNKRFHHGPHTVGCSVFPLDTGYIVAGYVSDTIPYFHLRTYISGFDSTGEEQWTKFYGDTLPSYVPRYDVNAVVSDSLFVIGCEGYSESVANTRLIWFDQHGDTLMTKTYVSPYSILDDWNKIVAISRDPSGNMYFSSVIFDSEQTDTWIVKIDEFGDVLWDSILQFGDDFNLCFALQATNDGVIGGGYVDPDADNTSLSRIFKLDINGVLDWTIFEEDFGFDSALPQELLLDEDKIIVASTLVSNGNGGIPTIYKLEESDVDWFSSVESDYMADQIFTNVVRATDGNYVAGGLNNEVLEESDTINGAYNINAWLAKFSTEGELMWDRTYHYVESDEDEHSLLDLKPTPDGGFVFCGEAEDWSDNPENEFPYQQAWLVKVDGCGCLVPGCDPNCTTGVEETLIDYNTTHFLAGPNPASQYINIYILDEGFSQDREVRIFDLQGKVVKAFDVQYGASTYMVDVEGLEIGVYLVSLIDDGEVRQTERIVKD